MSTHNICPRKVLGDNLLSTGEMARVFGFDYSTQQRQLLDNSLIAQLIQLQQLQRSVALPQSDLSREYVWIPGPPDAIISDDICKVAPNFIGGYGGTDTQEVQPHYSALDGLIETSNVAANQWLLISKQPVLGGRPVDDISSYSMTTIEHLLVRRYIPNDVELIYAALAYRGVRGISLFGDCDVRSSARHLRVGGVGYMESLFQSRNKPQPSYNPETDRVCVTSRGYNLGIRVGKPRRNTRIHLKADIQLNISRKQGRVPELDLYSRLDQSV